MLEAVPVVAVSAVRTGCGKSQVARWLARRACARGLRVAVIRHPMPYGDLRARPCSASRLRPISMPPRARSKSEEYEPHLAAGTVVFAGVITRDPGACCRRGRPDRVGRRQQRLSVRAAGLACGAGRSAARGRRGDHHPGTAVLGMADVVLIARRTAAAPALDARARERRALNPCARAARARR